MLGIILFNSASQSGSSENTEFLQLPTALSQGTAAPSNLVNTVLNASAGKRILLSSGNYNNLTLVNNTGTADNPVVICPADKNTSVTFTGVTVLQGTGHVKIYGVHFDQNGGTSDRLLRISGPNKTIAHSELSPHGIGVSGEASNSVNARIHRCLFNPPVNTSGSTGKASFKVGFKQSLSIDLDWRFDWCLFEGPSNQREHGSIKAAGVWMHDCQFNRNGDSKQRDLAVRHGRNALIERCRYNDGDIIVQGTGHVIRNCVCDAVILAKGTDDGDLEISGASTVYMSAKRCTVQQISGDLLIGDVPFTGSQFDTLPDDNNYSDITGNVVDNGTNTGVAPTISSEVVPIITPSQVGLSSYRTEVANAP